jgi:hypothetical protein
MNILEKINPRFIVTLDKFSIGLPHAEVIETKGKYLVFRASMTVDETLYKNPAGCSSVVDDSFVSKIIGVYTDGYAEQEKEMLLYAIQHGLQMTEVDAYKAYCQTTDSPMTASKWRNSELNKKHGTTNREYISSPSESYFERLEDALSYGEYRLGVFSN